MTDKTVAIFRSWLETSSIGTRNNEGKGGIPDRINPVAEKLLTVLNRNPGIKVIEQSLNEFLDAEADFDYHSLEYQWQIAGLAGVSLYEIVVYHLLDQTLPISNSILYWDDILDRGRIGLAFYGVQTLPLSIANQTGLWHFKHVAQLPPAETLIYGVVNSILGFSVPTMDDIIRFGTKLSRFQVTYLVNSPLIALKRAVKHNKQQLEALRRDIAHRIGLVVSKCFKPQGSLQSSIQTSISAMQAALRLEQKESETPIQAVKNLVGIINCLNSSCPCDSHLALLEDYKRPGFFARWWPGLLVGSYYSAKAIGNWQRILTWFQDQLLETSRSFWKNWIVKPIYSIYKTVRHDQDSQVALMTKQSLESDMRSLERMVIDFAKDNGEIESIDLLKERVQQGDLSIVLIPYEQQISSPISSLVRGQLIRSLLIQVQKTKVDVEVAMSGIDKMLQSQQLVFGLVAALPSIAIVYWLLLFSSGLINGKQRQIRGRSKTKEQILITLGKVRHILLENNDGRGKLTIQGFGLVLCETMLLRELGRQVLSHGLEKQWVSDLELIEDINVHIDRLVAYVDRLWMYRFFTK